MKFPLLVYHGIGSVSAISIINFRQAPGSGSVPESGSVAGSFSADSFSTRPGLARDEDHINVVEKKPDKSFLGHCYDLVASVVVLNDGDDAKIEHMLGTVCAQADISNDALLCSDLKKSFMKQIASRREFRRQNEVPLGHLPYGREQRWNEENFSAGTFCQSAMDLIVANRMAVGPAKPAGVLNTPVDSAAAAAAHEAYARGESPETAAESGSASAGSA